MIPASHSRIADIECTHDVSIATIVARDAAADLPLSAPAVELLEVAANALHYGDMLWSRALDADAVLFLAHALDARDSIWWGLVCMLALEHVAPDPAHGAGLGLVGDFSLAPSRERADEARSIARELALDPPVAWLLQAVWLSMPPEDTPVAAYRLGVTHAISAALKLGAATGPDPAAGAYGTNLRRFVELGLHVARGGDGGVDRLDPPSFPGVRRSPVVPRPSNGGMPG